MATVSSVVSAARGSDARGPVPYLVENEIDFSTVAVAPNAGDVVQAISIPANTMILSAGLEVTAALGVTGGTDAVVTLGTDTDADEWVTAFDADGASTGAYAPVAAAATAEIHGTANTLDLTFSATNVSSIDSGKFRVFAILMDIDAIGAMGPDEVDRDQLA